MFQSARVFSRDPASQGSRFAKVMLFAAALLAMGSAFAAGSIGRGDPARTQGPMRSRVEELFAKLPLGFEENRGQTAPEVQFLSRGSGYALFFTPSEVLFSLGKPVACNRADRGPLRGESEPHATPEPPHVVRMRFLGSSLSPKAFGLDPLPGKSNYFIGNEPGKWRTGVVNYRRLRYRNLYPGVDVVYYGNQRHLEYDLVFSPGANPQSVRLSFEGIDRLELDDAGDLILHTQLGDLRQGRPAIFQEIGGKRRSVAGHYVRTGRREVGFQVGGYDAQRRLIIDPVLSYSTYLGGSNVDNGFGIAVDSAGNAYIAGNTFSANFPTRNPIQAANGSPGSFGNAFVAKINAAGNALIYSTYLGGSGGEVANAVAVDAAGNAYVTGDTFSTNFPTQNPIQAANAGLSDAFVTKISAAGNALAYSTYLGGGGGENGNGIAVDNAGNAYVTGSTNSLDFPIRNGIRATNAGLFDAFVTKINAAGTALVYSTYLGGSGSDVGFGIALDNAGNAYVTGDTDSTNFPIQLPLQAVNAGVFDAFVTKINAAGTALAYSTYFGGSGSDVGFGIAMDGLGNAYVTGQTDSTNFPTKSPIQSAFGGVSDAFVAKINGAGIALVYSTYLGGSDIDGGYGIAVDGAGNAYVTGLTRSTNFPTQNAVQGANAGGYRDAFVTKINAAGTALPYSTYLGGGGDDRGYAIAVEGAGNTYVAGGTDSVNFPIRSAVQAAPGGRVDAFVAKLSTGPCTAGADTLCLNGSRFQVQVRWRVPSQGTSGVGAAVPFTADTGSFWFFSSNNIELMIKVVDGRAFNNKFWVFYGALSDVEYTITVSDTATGAVKTYFNPSGTLASVSDTAAFDGSASVSMEADLQSSAVASVTQPDLPAVLESVAAASSALPACVAGPTTLCLNSNRFQVSVSWHVPSQGTSGVGMAMPLTGDTGSFWFFSGNNVELVIKVVDGRPVNNRFWVFYGALSNVEYRITVTDTVSGTVKTYFNPNLNLASVADTSAF